MIHTTKWMWWAVLAFVGCGSTDPKGSEHSAPPASVSGRQAEQDLATVSLTPEAVRRLGLTLVPVERRAAPTIRTLAGDLVVPVGAGHGGTPLVVQGSVAAAERQRIADGLLAADEAAHRARIEATNAENTLQRAERMLRGGTGTQRDLDDARARHQAAQVALEAATVRRHWQRGALTGNPAALWVRVPVFAGERQRLDAADSVHVAPLGAAQGEKIPVSRAPGPATANPDTATVDFFYALPAPVGFQAGERVAVTFHLSETDPRHIVPHGSVMTDIHGGEWVYVETASNTFQRHRVQVAAVQDDMAILAAGPAEGAHVVAEGAAELFGVEFGAGK